MKKNALLVLIALNLLALITYGVYSVFTGRYQKNQMEVRAANGAEAEGEMRHEDYARLRSISRSSRGNGGFSDQDADWLLGLMQRPPLNPKDPLTAAVLHSDIMALFIDAKVYTPGQESKIYDACVPFLAVKVGSDPSSDHLEKICACRVMVSLKDQRAIPHILPLLKSPDPTVRTVARKVLARMGYTAT